jgi:hypothetical protein
MRREEKQGVEASGERNGQSGHLYELTERNISMEHSYFWEADGSSASQGIIRTLWNNSPPLLHILIQINPVHPLPTSSFNIHLHMLSHLRLGPPSSLFLSGFPTEPLCAFPSSPYLPHDPNNTLGEECTLWSPRYAVFCSPQLLPPFQTQMFLGTPPHSITQHPQTTLLPQSAQFHIRLKF